MTEQNSPVVGGSEPRVVRVVLGARSYDVVIGPGLLAAAGGHLARHFGAARYAIVTDANVADSGHLAALEATIQSSGRVLGSIVLRPGEATKSFPELAALSSALLEKGVELRGCPKTCSLVPQAKRATDADYFTEFLDLILSIRVVDSLEEAVEHITKYGSKHTEAIITNDLRAAERFTAMVDSSAVMVNASTRFNDGFEFGLGAESGISTDTFHARGPCGLEELCSYKYLVLGDGQIRE